MKIKSFLLKGASSFVKKRALLLQLIVAFIISDLFILKSYTQLLPPSQLPKTKTSSQLKTKSIKNYSLIFEKNIFHEGEIPSKLLVEGEDPTQPVKSSLPFSLQGTIVHSNPSRSVASIKTDKSRSYKLKDAIEGQAVIKKIERRRVVFFNNNNNQLEYIEIPEETNRLSLASQAPKSPGIVKAITGVVTRVKNQFTAKRSDINSYLANLPKVLKTARVVPYRKKGVIGGFRFASIDKKSIFNDLGFQVGDVIKQVDNEKVTTPEQAINLFERLKESSGFKVVVEREGQDIEYDYNVSEDAPIN